MTAGAGKSPAGRQGALRWLTYLVLLPSIALATAAFGCVAMVCGVWDRSGRQQHAIARTWARTLILISLSPVELTGAEHLVASEAAVYASNHLSYYDTQSCSPGYPFSSASSPSTACGKLHLSAGI